MHLACGVFRAVETRLPLVIAANGGISAWIDRIGPRPRQSPRAASRMSSSPTSNRAHMHSWYVRFGDWFAGAVFGLLHRLRYHWMASSHAQDFDSNRQRDQSSPVSDL